MKKTEKINKSRLMKRAWYLARTKYYSLSFALSTVWSEMKEAIKSRINAAIIIENDKNPQNSISMAFNPSPESMQEFYNSNEYKGD